MPFVKGKSGNAKGKPKGAENKTTKETKEAIRLLVEDNLDNLTLWLEKVAKDSPERALRIVIDLLEYNIPKLSRTELMGNKEEPITVNFIPAKRED